MSGIRQIREAIARTLSVNTGIQVSPYVLSNPSPPYATVHALETEYDVSYDDDAYRQWFGVRVVVAYTSDIAAQAALDEFRAGANAVRFLLEADQTLGGVCDSVHVVSAGPDTFYGEGAVGCEFRVEVLT